MEDLFEGECNMFNLVAIEDNDEDNDEEHDLKEKIIRRFVSVDDQNEAKSVDAEGQVDREREAAWLKKTQARSGKHAHDTTGLGSSEEHGVAGGGERHISNRNI